MANLFLFVFLLFAFFYDNVFAIRCMWLNKITYLLTYLLTTKTSESLPLREQRISLHASYSLPTGLKTISHCHSSHVRAIVTHSL